MPTSADRGRRRWHFAGAVLDERSLDLLINGADVELERKPLEVLMYMLQRAGEVCTKDELLEGVWPGRVLSETVLTKCIGRLREVLGDRNQDIIKTAYGFGYRLVASVQVEVTSKAEPAHFDFRPGDHPPARPLWNLVERLGIGGHGEAWRGRHEKTHEQRVFKFALDADSLGALKREITLFRIINDSLGERARVVRLLDWNLEQAPYFIESECIKGGSLLDWAAARGAIAALPLTDRLEVVASIATALAAVHSVGVLHKDLKPSNILVKPGSGAAPEICLADFGSGGIFDAGQIDRLGITRLGFTRTMSAAEITAGTPLYLAPEILAGQPFTVKSDVYALGVIFYQLMVGDFHRVMSPGWEHEIDDELLREDILLVTQGNPALRLADADILAQRLRALDERRARLTAEREALAKAERSRQLLERVRARRFGLLVAFITLAVGLATSTALYIRARHSQQRTEVAAAQSKAVTEYLSKDVFAPVSTGKESVKDMTVVDLLTRAGNQVDTRFAAQPEVASELHYVIGRSLEVFYEADLAVPRFKRALDLGQQVQGAGSEPALLSAAELIYMDYVLGSLPTTISRYEAFLKASAAKVDAGNLALLSLRQKLAWGHFKLGKWQQSADELSAVLADIPPNSLAASEFTGHTQLYLGQALTALAKPAEAVPLLRSAIGRLSATLSEKHADVSESHNALGLALANSGDYAGARVEIDEALQLAEKWAPPGTWTIGRPRTNKALLQINMDQLDDAVPALAQIVAFQDENTGVHPDLDHTGPVRQALGEAYLRQGKVTDSIAVLQKALAVSTVADGPAHPSTRSIRLSLAESLIAGSKLAEARQTLATPAPINLDDLPPVHPYAAQLHRADGLLALQSGDIPLALEQLRKAKDIYEALYGAKQWRTVRAQRELHSVSR